jgi:CDP-4-dehydro-6-deoxyglucose reductase
MPAHVTLQPSGHQFELLAHETLLEGALRQGYGLPYGCRSGSCGTCKGQVISGEVDLGDYQAGALSEAEVREGKALFCLARPRGDVVVEARLIAGVRDIVVRKLPVRVESIERPNHDVAVLKLKLPATEKFHFLPGQYIDFLMPDGKRRSFSLAGTPGDGALLELHIRHYPGGNFSRYVFEELKPRTILRIEGPLGTFFLREDSDKPLIFMAGGTGFAPIKGIIEHAIAAGCLRPMVLYWGARSLADLYMAELAGRWQSENPLFSFVPVLSEPLPDDHWPGRTGLVHEAILADFADLSGFQVYACGAPLMVDAGKRSFIGLRGLPESEFFSDPFTVSLDATATATVTADATSTAAPVAAGPAA